jgi:GNAT superfamily N-acetyltransferase
MDLEISTSRELSIAHLSGSPFDNLITLKMLSMYPNECATTLYRDESGWVCRTELGAGVSAWDRNEYPLADRIVMLDGNSPSIFGHVLRHQPTGLVVYKVHDQRSRFILGEDPQFHHANAFHSYSGTSRGLDTGRFGVPDVEQHSHYDDEAAALFVASGYAAQDFRFHIDRGAQWFAVREKNRIVSFCLAFQIIGKIWEIGGVLTRREYRRRGFAKAVMSAALGYVNAFKLIPRYQFHYRNSASRYLAESLGLKQRLIVDHYVNAGVKRSDPAQVES